jgi:hypothetical protein
MKNLLSKTFRVVLLFLLTSAIHTSVKAWSNGPLLTDSVKFRVNMSYMVSNGTFHPSSDTLVMKSDQINDSLPSPMQRPDSTYIYEITYLLTSGVVYSYQFNIHHAGIIINENVDSFTRLIRVKNTLNTVTNYFNNFNPATIPMTFNCDMYYQIKAGHFFSSVDYLDVAGNFNNGGAYDVLYPRSKDSIYTVTVFLDTALYRNTVLKFKFRFNGDSATQELNGDSSRTYTLHDTIGNNPDTYTCWYNNIDPRIPALPIAYNLSIQDSLIAKKILTGIYSYEDYNLKPEGHSLYKWYRADSIGGVLTLIQDTSLNYTIDSVTDIGKYLVFEVTPVTFDNEVGLAVRVYTKSKIFGVGINDPASLIARIYPNPVKSLLFIELLQDVERIELLNMTGQSLRSMNAPNSGKIEINVNYLSQGIYFLKIYGKYSAAGIYKILLVK